MQFKSEILQLAALRQSRGVTLESIAESTKISLYYLKAIEDCDIDKLPSGLYTDSFLHQYAQAIDADLAQELLEKLNRASQEAAQAASSPIATNGMVRALKDIIARGTTVAFLLGTGGSLMAQGSGDAPAGVVAKDDPRLHLIRNFFEDCPLAANAADFIVAADRNGLDWRLLPSIAWLESTGGKYQIGQNPLGWGSGLTKFKSMAHAIHHVAQRLAVAPAYAAKDLRGKLRTYNPARPDYADKVIATMQRLSPAKLTASRTHEVSEKVMHARLAPVVR